MVNMCMLLQVVMEDKRQLCVFQQAAQRKEPWLWWRYAAAFSGACTMANGRFASPDCAEGVLRTLGLDVGTVAACMGDSEANEDHPLLQVRGGDPCMVQICSGGAELTRAWRSAGLLGLQTCGHVHEKEPASMGLGRGVAWEGASPSVANA